MLAAHLPWIGVGPPQRFKRRPMIFHYVNVGPNVKPEEMITDVYLPLL